MGGFLINEMVSNTMNSISARQVVDVAAHGMEVQAESFVKNYRNGDNKDFRLASLAKLKEIGYPNTRQEEWKYTDLSHITREKLEIHQNIETEYSDQLINTIKEYISSSAIYAASNTEQCIVLVDGEYRKDLSTLVTSKNIIDDINDSDLQDNAVSKNSIVDYINCCYLGGVYINITDTSKVNNIRILNVFTGFVNSKIVNIKNKCTVASNATLNLIEDYVVIDSLSNSEIDSHKELKLNSNILFDFDLKPGSICKHTIAQSNGDNNYHIAYYNVNQSKNSEYHNYNINLGAKLVRQDIIIHQNDQHTTSYLNGVFLANNNQHMDSHLKVYHNSSHGKSKQNYRAVLADRAHGVFNGVVFVAEGTVDNNAVQNNKNILLSKHAEMDTKPELQIYADDVVCSHGATIGRLDEAALFYLQTRGMDKRSATTMLIVSFINHIVEMIDDEELLAWIKTRLNSKLEAITGSE